MLLLRLSSVCRQYTECIVVERCVLEQKLLLTAYRKTETVRDRGLVSKDHQQEMAYGEIKQLRHVTPQGQVVTQIRI